MALALFLSSILFILFTFSYLKLIFQHKRGVKVSAKILTQIDNSKVKSDILQQPPGPFPMPIIGNLAMLGKFSNPNEGFNALSKIYGNVYSLSLASTRCIVLSDLEMIKEVLNQNAKFFGDRPNFEVKKPYGKKLVFNP